MNRSSFAVMVGLLLLCHLVVAAEPVRPNIICILSDDMGFSDLGCYGGEIQTPNLDALGTGGVRFTQFYNTARCCPTRASLLTGLYPHQAGVGHMTNDNGLAGYRGELNRNCVTIAEVLKGAGYATYMTGKWHVTRNDTANADDSAWPLQRGFDKFYGTVRGGGSFYDPTALCRQNTFITPVNDSEYQPETFYYTDAISDNAVKYLQQHEQESADRPFFLYVAYTAAHWPMHALEKDIAKYRGKYDTGYEAIRKARFERMQKLGLIAEDAQLTTEPDAWSKVTDKAWEARCMEVYAAMVDNMDAGIGRIVEQLKKNHQWDNTLILFLQDNGGCAEGVGRQSNAKAAAKLQPLGRDELQLRGAPPMQTRDGRQVRTGPGVMPGPADTFIGYGRDWARVSNTPFREFKHWTHEGGISTPLIAHWPQGIAPAAQGKLYRESGHLIDIMATCVDLSGASYPELQNEQTIKPMEGKSLRPAFSNLPLTAEPRAIFWEHEGNRAIREGAWKLVAKEGQPWELYDIAVDRTELNNLAAQHPDRVKDMAAKWEAYAARADVLPLGGWRGRITSSELNKDRRFVLKAGEKLSKQQAPAFVGKTLSITATFDTGKARNGVLVAHGGSLQGYALHLVEGKPTFSLRTTEGLRRISGPDAIEGAHLVAVKVQQDGSVSLSIDDKIVASSKAGPMPVMPAEGVDIGEDLGGTVGDYKSPNTFDGQIDSVVIELE